MNQQTSNSLKVYNTAKSLIGQALAPDPVLGCAETVNIIFKQAIGVEAGGEASTQAMYTALQDTKRFTFITRCNALPGDIIISPTGLGKYPHGHVGIVAIYGILSNSSSDGRLHENYDIDTWTNYFERQGGFPVLFFRVI